MATSATVKIHLPEEVHSKARAIAWDDNVPLDEVLAYAIDRNARLRGSFEKMLHEDHMYGRQTVYGEKRTSSNSPM